jgi:hypothetical protein
MSGYRVPIQKVQLVRDGSVMIPSANLHDSEASAALVHELIGTPDREHLLAIGLDARNRALGVTIVAIGSESAAWCASPNFANGCARVHSRAQPSLGQRHYPYPEGCASGKACGSSVARSLDYWRE